MIIEQEVFINLNFELEKLHEKIEVIKKLNEKASKIHFNYSLLDEESNNKIKQCKKITDAFHNISYILKKFSNAGVDNYNCRSLKDVNNDLDDYTNLINDLLKELES